VFALKRAIHEAQDLIHRLETLLDAAREMGAPVVFTRHRNGKFLIPGSEAWQILAEVEPRTGETVVEKEHLSAFDHTTLAEVLETLGTNKLAFCGLISNGCVKASCEDALRRGYDVVLLSDGHGTFYAKPETIVASVNADALDLGARLTTVEEYARSRTRLSSTR
jgi:nicotinamidase-related amidase